MTIVPGEHQFTQEHYKQHVRSILRLVFEVATPRDPSHENLFPLPVTLSESNFRRLLQSSGAVVCEKTDGVRYLILLSVWPDTKERFAIAVDRNFNLWELHVAALDHFFEMVTVFDAELVWEFDSRWDSPRQLFLIYDCYMLAGESFLNKPLLKRIEALDKHISLTNTGEKMADILEDPGNWVRHAQRLAKGKFKIVSLGNKFGLGFKPKTFYRLEMINTLCRHFPKLNHSSDGLIFTSVSNRMHPGKNSSILKWKFMDTVDLGLSITQRETETAGSAAINAFKTILFAMNQSVPVILSPQDFALNTENHVLNSYLQTLLPLKLSIGRSLNSIIECKLQPIRKDGRLLYMCDVVKIRQDKHEPNSLQTIQHTIESVNAPVLLQHLINLCGGNSGTI